MSQITLGKWLKAIIAEMGVCGLIFYGFIVPKCMSMLMSAHPEYAVGYYPWLVVIWISGIPCYLVLVFAWKVALNIQRDRSFSMENARLLKWVAVMAIGDVTFFFACNVIFLLCNRNHPAIVFASLLIVFIGVAIAVAAVVLSHLISKAALLQEQSDLTI